MEAENDGGSNYKTSWPYVSDPLNHAVITNFAENRKHFSSLSHIRQLSELSPDQFHFHNSTVVTAASSNYGHSGRCSDIGKTHEVKT